MVDFDELKGSIKLDGETVFYHHLSQNKEKLKLFRESLINGKIGNFDQSLISRLRQMYFGYYSAILYLFCFPTTFDNIGNKVELLAHALEDKDFKIVHGFTDSTRDIPFFMYGVEHLDSDSWIEVREGHKTYVYDPFSLLKFEKDIFYQLEHPDVTGVVSKSTVQGHKMYRDSEFRTLTDGFNFMLTKSIPEMERSMPKHPFKDILIPEICRFKKLVNYEKIELDYEGFQKKKSID